MTGVEQDLWCTKPRLEYDFQTGSGNLYMQSDECCDMKGCIALFERIDSNVLTIKTYSGGEPDTAYIRHTTGWERLPSGSRF